MEAAELIKLLRNCASRGGECSDCQLYKTQGDWCIDVLLNSAADAIEKATVKPE